eukprot:EG_transcript_12716
MDDEEERVDFAALAAHHAGFRQHVMLAEDGQARIRWNDPLAIKALTAATLSYKYHIEWDIPDDSLCPPVPNRATYLRWMDRLLRSTVGEPPETGFHGIDVGTGASCIYPLLGVALFGHRFLATDTAADSLAWAARNVAANGWEDKVQTRLQTDPSAVLNGMVGTEECYDFVVCNPPFFDTADSSPTADADAGADESPEEVGGPAARRGGHGVANPRRPRSDRATVLRPGEHATEGGEVAFVGRMIDESLELRERVVWYSAMLGCKRSLSILRRRLESEKDISLRCTTIAHGRTTRWLLGWTFFKFGAECSGGVKPVAGPPPKRQLEETPAANPAKRPQLQATVQEPDKKGVCGVRCRLGPGASGHSLLPSLREVLQRMGATQVTLTAGALSATLPDALLAPSHTSVGASCGRPAPAPFQLSVRLLTPGPGPEAAVGFALHLPGSAKPLPA